MEVQNTTKYYDPEIEDIRVGYECEMSLDTPNKQWRPVVLREKDFEPFSWYDHHEERPTYRKVIFRTPYLTREQIEKEGWEVYHGWIDHAGGRTHEVHGRSKKYFFSYINGQLVISFAPNLDSGDKTTRTIYEGACPSINELRKLTKLLNIPKCQNQELTKNPNPL